MQNVYKKENLKLFKKSFCAYLDVLGFKEIIKKNEIEYFKKYLAVFEKELKYLDVNYDRLNDEGFKNFELKVFTDNFVFGYPWDDDNGEFSLGQIFYILAHMQMTFACSNIFVRGAITVSNLYMDENIVFGPAVVEAYELESTKSIYPRIILSDAVIKAVHTQINFYADYRDSPQFRTFLKDTDGEYFINYLYILNEEHTYEEINNLLESHKNIIIKNLNSYKTSYKIFIKYSWLAKYHNYYCKHFLTMLEEKFADFSIDENLYSSDIMPIVHTSTSQTEI